MTLDQQSWFSKLDIKNKQRLYLTCSIFGLFILLLICIIIIKKINISKNRQNQETEGVSIKLGADVTITS